MASSMGGATGAGVFDYIVVGAGSAGCVLCGRLAAAQPDARIALLEYGADVVDRPSISSPVDWGRNLGGPADYAYQTDPQPAFGQRWISYPRGRGLGGSSLINALIYSRGFRVDWDRMPEGWRSADVEPLFEGIEARLRLTTVRQGTFGLAVAAAAGELGFPLASSDNWEVGGLAETYRVAVDSERGRRVDVYRAMGANRGNVKLIRGRAQKVLTEVVDGSHVAVGVEIGGSSGPIYVRRGGEVVLCAGAVDTPKLLQLSGIGPADLLASLHIPLVQDAPVGHGLKDHTLLAVGAMSNLQAPDLTPNGIQGFINDEDNRVQLMLCDGSSLPGLLPSLVRDFANRPGWASRIRRVLLRYVLAPLLRLLLGRGRGRAMIERAVGINVCLTRPSSTGTVMIRSRDPGLAPAIDPKFLSTEGDRESMLRGLETAQRILASRAVAPLIETHTSGLDKTTPKQFVMNGTGSYWHPTGTCAIGTCLDTELRVIGVSGLRVADASALPVHPRVPTQAACMVVGAKCADVMVGARSVSTL